MGEIETRVTHAWFLFFSLKRTPSFLVSHGSSGVGETALPWRDVAWVGATGCMEAAWFANLGVLWGHRWVLWEDAGQLSCLGEQTYQSVTSWRGKEVMGPRDEPVWVNELKTKWISGIVTPSWAEGMTNLDKCSRLLPYGGQTGWSYKQIRWSPYNRCCLRLWIKEKKERNPGEGGRPLFGSGR